MGAESPSAAGGSDQLRPPISEEDRARFVDLLVSARHRSGRSLDDITTITKVPPRHLESLEQGRVELLPGGVYRRAIVRNYAQAVGLDPDATLTRFSQIFGAEAVLPEWQGIPGIPTTPENPGVLRQALAMAPVVVARLPSFRSFANPARMLPQVSRIREQVRPLALGAVVGIALATAVQFLRDEMRSSPQTAPASAETAPAAAIAPTADSTRREPAAQRTGGSVPTVAAPAPLAVDAAPGSAGAVSTSLSAADAAQLEAAGGPGPVVGESRLVITSRPSGARVTVNGIGWGVTPVTVRHLPPGDKVVRVTKDGYLGQERVIRVGEQGGAYSVALTLREED